MNQFLWNQESHAFFQLLLDLISSCKSFCINVHMFLAILVKKIQKDVCTNFIYEPFKKVENVKLKLKLFQ